MAKRTEAEAEKLSSHLWAALGYVAKKRTRRDLVTLGTTKVDVQISGKVGRAKVDEHIVGTLELSEDTQRAATEAANPTEVIAILLAELPDAAATIKRVADYHAKHKSLPEVADEHHAAAKSFLALLRSQVIKPVAGSITFEVSE